MLGEVGHGLIPAHAGKTLLRLSRSRAARAHPRSRGENDRRTYPELARVGSSPLTRGKRGHGRHVLGCSGLIPAHAGKTPEAAIPRSCQGAHPRSRGENPERAQIAPKRHGSSPLTRGKPGKHTSALPRTRLIPAHAGKTRVTTRR